MRIIRSYLLAIIIVLSFLATVVRADVLENWTTNQISAFQAPDCIVYGNGCYVVPTESGDTGWIFYSTNDTGWTLSNFTWGWGISMHYINGSFIGVDSWGDVATSPNGTNWKVSGIPNWPIGDYADIAYQNGLYVVVGTTNDDNPYATFGAIYYSSDGTNWNMCNIPEGGGVISSVAYGNSTFAAIGIADNVSIGNPDTADTIEYTSNDGINWFTRSFPGGNQIVFYNGIFIVPLNDRTNLISTNGIGWSLQNTGLTNRLAGITYSHGLFLAEAGTYLGFYQNSSGNYLASSTDGTNWFQYGPTIPGNGGISPAYTSRVAVVTDGTRLTSIGFGGYNGEDEYIYTSDVLVSLRTTNSPSLGLALSGLVGRTYQIQSVDELAPNSNLWRTNITLLLTNTPYFWTDTTATNTSRFYRASLLP